MDTRKIGSLDVSLVGLGCNNFGMRIDEKESVRVVHVAIDAGITFFDTADIYGGTKSEVFLGRALSGRRDAVVIATKFGMRVDAERHGARPEYVRRAADDSLRRLSTDHIDLYPAASATRSGRADRRDPRGRSTISCARGRFGRSAAQMCRPSNFVTRDRPRRRTRRHL